MWPTSVSIPSSYNVHELRAYIQQKFERGDVGKNLLISVA